MKKTTIAIVLLYSLIVLLYNLMGWMLQKEWIPMYQLKDVHPIDIKELQKEKILSIEYIDETDNVYILTQQGEFIIMSISNHKVIYKTYLNLVKNFKDMRCVSQECVIANGANLDRVNFSAFQGFKKNPDIYRLLSLDNTIEKILSYSSFVGAIVRDKNGKIHTNYSKMKNIYEKDMRQIKILRDWCDTGIVNMNDPFINNTMICQNFFSISIVQNHGRLTLFNFYGIKDMAIDSEVFLSANGGDVVFVGNDNYLFYAKTDYSYGVWFHRFLEPLAYLPLIPFLGKQ